MGLTLTEAVSEAKKGKRITRGGWGPGKPDYVEYAPARADENCVIASSFVQYIDYNARNLVGGVVVLPYYLFDAEDVSVSDWYVVGAAETPEAQHDPDTDAARALENAAEVG